MVRVQACPHCGGDSSVGDHYVVIVTCPYATLIAGCRVDRVSLVSSAPFCSSKLALLTFETSHSLKSAILAALARWVHPHTRAC